MLTFLNISENLKLLLTMQGLSYIADTRKELNAITKFTMESFTPDYVIELIGKLIEIKRHSKLGKETFWIGCAINLSDAYSYRVKIETVYPTIAETPIRQSVATDCPVGSYPLSIVPTDAWIEFINWSKSHLTRTSVGILIDIMPEVDGRSLTIRKDLSEFLRHIIIKFFQEEIKPSILIIFEKPKTQEDKFWEHPDYTEDFFE